MARNEEPSKCDLLSVSTVATLLPLWMENIAGNLQTILEDKDVRHILCPDLESCPMHLDIKKRVKEKGVEEVRKETKLDEDIIKHILGPFPSPKICGGCPNFKPGSGPALVIGAGPSLYENKHLDILAEQGFNGKIFAVSKVLKDILEHGIVPDYATFLDAAEEDTSFIDHDIVDEHADEITALMSVNIHPTTVERWRGKRRFYMGYIGEDAIPNISHTIFLLTKAVNISTCGNTGSAGWSLAAFLGHNPIVLIGMDLGWKNKEQVHEYYPSIPKGQLEERLGVKRYRHPVFNTTLVDRVFDVYREAFLSWIKTLKKTMGLETWNCTGGGILYAKGVRCIPFEQALEELNDNL